MSIRPPINGSPTNVHPEVIKLSEALARSEENIKKVRKRIQTIRDKNTIASVSRRHMQKRLDEQYEWFSEIANDEKAEVYLDENNELVIEQS